MISPGPGPSLFQYLGIPTGQDWNIVLLNEPRVLCLVCSCTESGRTLVTYMSVFLPEAVSEQWRVLRPWSYGNELAISKPDLIEDFPGQIPTLVLSDPWVLP